MTQETDLHLLERLVATAGAMPLAQREALKVVLSLAASRLPSDGEYPTDPVRNRALRLVVKCLSRLYPRSELVPPNGVAYRGRPTFMTDDLLRLLQKEARLVRRERPIAQTGHWLGAGGPIADKVAVSREMAELVERTAEPIRATGVASYIFYDEPGQALKAHVDTGIFELNANLMLEHESSRPPASFLYVCPPDGEPERLRATPGEIVLSYAGSIVHGRSPVDVGERVSILTLGFQPIEAEAQVLSC